MATKKVLTFTPVVDTAIYASGDVMFIAQELSGVMNDTGGTANLISAVVLDKDNEKVTFDLLFFDSNPANTLGAINAAYALNDADFAKLMGRISVLNADYISSGTNSAEATYKNIQLLLKSAARSKSLWLVGVIRAGTPTFTAATDVKIQLGFEVDEAD